MKREVIEILIKQMEDSLAAIKRLLAEDITQLSPVEPKKKKLNAVSREELIKKFGMHTQSVENSQDEPSDTMEPEDVKDTSSKEPDTDVHIESEKIIIDDEKQKLPDIECIDLNKVDVKPIIAVGHNNVAIKINDDPDTEEALGREILTHLNLDDAGVSVVRLQKRYFDNGCEKLFIDKWHVNVMLLDDEMKVIKTQTVTWKSMTKFHYLLKKRGIDRHTVSPNPHKNWMPRTVNIDLR